MTSIVRKLHLLYNMLLQVSQVGFYDTHKIVVVFPHAKIYTITKESSQTSYDLKINYSKVKQQINFCNGDNTNLQSNS